MKNSRNMFFFCGGQIEESNFIWNLFHLHFVYQIGLQSAYNWIQTILRSWSLTISSKSLSLARVLSHVKVQTNPNFKGFSLCHRFMLASCFSESSYSHHFYRSISKKKAKTKNLEKWKLGSFKTESFVLLFFDSAPDWS